MIRAFRSPALVWLLVAVVSLWLRSFFPVHVIGSANLDDALFIRLARSISTGHWLGPFTDTTLAKGAFYPVFIAASFATGIPLKLAEQAVYLAAAALVASRAPSRTVGTVLFIVLAFVPALWAAELARVIREGLYIGLSLAVIGAAVSIATAPTRRNAVWRGAGLGLLAGAFWLTREEGVWLVPSLLAVLALGAWRAGGRFLVAPVAAAALGWGALVGGNVAYNWSAYRVAETVDVRSSAFQHAYGAISRIEHQQWRRFVVFPADARALAYRASPAARELQPFFDGASGEAWRQVGCRWLPGQDCSEILSPWFQWALRDAARQAGHYRTAREVMRFYTRLAQEIDAACDTGQIACLSPRATLAVPFQWSYLADAAGPAWSLLAILSTLGGNSVGTAPSEGSLPDIETFADVVGPIARKPVEVTELLGRLTAQHGTPLLRVQPSTGLPAWMTSVALDGPGFALSTDCPPAACDVVISVDTQDVATLPLANLPPHLDTPEVTLDFIRIRSVMLYRDSGLRGRVGLAVTRVIGRCYALIGPVLLLTGVLGLILTPIRRRDLVRTPLFALVSGSFIAVACRIGLLAYVDVTAIPSVNLLYLSPAIPFAIVAGVGGTALLVACWRNRTLT